MMKRRHIGILCLQETRIAKTPYYYTDSGFLVILSGSSTEKKEWAGVGFLIAPWLAKSLTGFLQQSSRLCCLKLRVPGGKLAVICAYAPHSGYPFDARQQFFEDLGDMFRNTSVNGIKMVFGDLNARLIRRIPGEESYLGEHIFGDSEANLQLGSNRELLLELCSLLDLAVTNTYFEHAAEHQATFRSICTAPGAPVNAKCFAQLDFLLVPQGCLHKVLDVRSDMTEALASHHFLVLAEVAQNFDKPLVKCPCAQIDRASLRNLSIRNSFQALFEESLQPKVREKHSGSLDSVSDCITRAFEAAEMSLPKVAAAKRKPWISQTTLDLVERRHSAHMTRDFETERLLHSEIKKAAKTDKKRWLEELAGANSWRALRVMRCGTRHLQGKLCDDRGIPVSSECRADTFAKYLESVQWAVRPASLVENEVINEELPMHLGPITLDELRRAVKTFKPGKSVGPDGHPVEYWKAMLENGSTEASEWLLRLWNLSWESYTVPQSWHLSRVACIYKKGDPGNWGTTDQ